MIFSKLNSSKMTVHIHLSVKMAITLILHHRDATSSTLQRGERRDQVIKCGIEMTIILKKTALPLVSDRGADLIIREDSNVVGHALN